MTCVRIPGGIVCLSPFFRLRLADGSCVFMEWHDYCGPTFFHDRAARRTIDEWWDNTAICSALDWFIRRGKRA